ncbi:BspA family leucine-rich repeat surface protein [Halorhodospira halochloris]|uniref:BspA family leucine-rich repeat surface protein n=1 Tax=Halorhodospira halochloris TaxID=1052 RepID=UPI001EE89AAE|nr:BspA family leucine-rich repeat surface protein [Halorhodospira halochloris]MCG5530543.1 BspA family leucine-rich repeat surface protein [Halorhodospira halochloris]
MANDELHNYGEGWWINATFHTDSVRDLALGHEILYSASDDGTVGFFDRETGEHLGSWEYGSELDKIRAVEVTEGYVYMAGTTGNIYRAEKPADLEDIQQPDDDEFIEFEPNYDQYGVHDLAIDYDDPELLYAVGYDGSVRAYSTDLEKEWEKEDVHDHSDSGDGDGRGVVSVELSDDGDTVFSAGHNGRTVVAQDAENGEEQWTISLDDVDDDTPGDIVDMALAGDVLSVISSKGKYYEFDTNDEGDLIYEYPYYTDFDIRSVDAIPAPWSPEDWGDEYEEISSNWNFVGAGSLLLEGGEGSLELYMGHIDEGDYYVDEYGDTYPIMRTTYNWDPDDFDPEDMDDSPDMDPPDLEEPPNFEITQGPDLDPETVEWGDSFDITSTVQNSSEVKGSQEVTVSVSGKEVYAKDLELDGGESSEISTTVETDEWDWPIGPGDYEVAINTEDDSATSDLTLEAPSDVYRVSDEDDLRQALADEDGLVEDTLEIWIDGEISVSESLTYDLDVDLKIKADGTGAALLGDGDGRLLDVTGAPEKVEIDGVDLRDGSAEQGGGGAIRAGSTGELHLSDMELSGNEAMAGYGGAVQARAVIAEQVYFNENKAVAGGAIHQNGWSNQSLELHEVIFEGNDAITRGGAIKTRRADLDLDHAAVNSSNEAGIAGDALYTRLGDHTGDIEGVSIGDSAGQAWGTAEVEISDFDLMEDEYSVEVGETFEVTAATLKNAGKFLGSRNIELEINGEKLVEHGWVDADDSEIISFDIDPVELGLEKGNYEIILRTQDGDEKRTDLTIDGAPDEPSDLAHFEVTEGPDLEPETIEAGEAFEVTGTVTNEGEETATQTVTLSVAGEQVESWEAELGEGETFPIEESLDASDLGLEVGETYEVEIETGDHSASAGLTVGDPDVKILTVTRDQLRDAVEDGSYAIDHGGVEYTFGDSEYNIDTSEIRDMYGLFEGATDFNEDIGYWDTSNVEYMEGIFWGAESFDQDISEWDTSNVRDMWSMFEGAESFDQDISEWDTSNVLYMDRMFRDAESFDQDLSSWFVPEIDSTPSHFADGAAFEGEEDKFPQWGLGPDSAEFTITDGLELDPAEIDLGEEFDVTGTVENTGEETGSRTISVSVGGEEVFSSEVELADGATHDLAATVEAGDWSMEPGTHEVEIATGDDSATADLTVEDEGETFTGRSAKDVNDEGWGSYADGDDILMDDGDNNLLKIDELNDVWDGFDIVSPNKTTVASLFVTDDDTSEITGLHFTGESENSDIDGQITFDFSDYPDDWDDPLDPEDVPPTFMLQFVGNEHDDGDSPGFSNKYFEDIKVDGFNVETEELFGNEWLTAPLSLLDFSFLGLLGDEGPDEGEEPVADISVKEGDKDWLVIETPDENDDLAIQLDSVGDNNVTDDNAVLNLESMFTFQDDSWADVVDDGAVDEDADEFGEWVGANSGEIELVDIEANDLIASNFTIYST